MKRLLIFTLVTFLLMACQQNTEQENDIVAEDNQTNTSESSEETNNDSELDTDIDTEKETTTDKEASEEEQTDNNENKTEDSTDKNQELDEYKTIAEYIEMDNHEIKIVEDNPNKRVSLIVDENGQERYKTIYIKKKNRLKIIQFNKGEIFNEII